MAPGDIIDEFAGHILHNPPQGKVNIVIVTNTIYYQYCDVLAFKNSKKLFKWSCFTAS